MGDDRPVRKKPDDWPVTFEAASDAVLDSTLAATPAQRLAWLEEALILAFRAKRQESD